MGFGGGLSSGGRGCGGEVAELAWQGEVIAEGIFTVTVFGEALDIIQDTLVTGERDFDFGRDVDFPEGLEAGDFIQYGVDIAGVASRVGFEGGDGLFEEDDVALFGEEEEDASHPGDQVG